MTVARVGCFSAPYIDRSLQLGCEFTLVAFQLGGFSPRVPGARPSGRLLGVPMTVLRGSRSSTRPNAEVARECARLNDMAEQVGVVVLGMGPAVRNSEAVWRWPAWRVPRDIADQSERTTYVPG